VDRSHHVLSVKDARAGVCVLSPGTPMWDVVDMYADDVFLVDER